ncbi:efflux RND transporter permease subunit [Octadecabacter sp. 1_MG-2023]|uniref:efflux RND transporter permease subunit n=1 Tax=unclassified Octadecabacter TaxID=196158 RepID=UPI001C096FBF|nr:MULTISPECIES: efflux RND transporter permease subunit [unclassified Octadecabacter]MBU2994164.1 efflux RND transporter permease subunit [Octadecabacter sp. B2R22]MDO6734547.1 efflux RND transporter permease subunit [Octadecabacter sp. 1_MG-2023]
MKMSAGGILSYLTRHATAANLLLIIMLGAGIAAFPKMRAQFFPDVIVDSVSVSVQWTGAGAEDVDDAVVQVLQPALLGVEGVLTTTSTSSEGSARIFLEFEPGWDMAKATEDVQLAVDATSNLPDDAEDPTVRRGQWSDRVTDVVITGPVAPAQLARFADEFVVRLFAQGVTRTTIRGVAAPSTIIEVPSIALVQYDISMSEISNAIGQEVTADPVGDVSGAARVRTGVERRTADEIEAIVLRTDLNGATLTVGDVAQVFVEGVDRERTYYVGGNPAISIRVDRAATGDAIKLQETVEQVAQSYAETLPNGSSIDLIRARAEQITGRLNILYENALLGLALVVTLLFLFLNARTAFWVAAGIPAAMCGAIALMWLAGLTINMISLFALIITLGIVVDDAIVVGEHADYRHRKLGEDPAQAAENAAKKMFSPVFSATLTTIIAFFALVLVGGRFGDLISDIPFTVIVVLIASLLECFFILPHHMYKALSHTGGNKWYDAPSRVVNRGFDWFKETLFRPFMAGVIWARYPVMAFAVVLLSVQAASFIRGDVQWRFFSSPEQGSVTGNFAMLPGATRTDTMEMMQSLQEVTETLGAEYEAEHGTNPLDYVIAEIGGNSGRGIAGSDTKDADQLGSIAIELIDADVRPYSSAEFVTALQDRVIRHPMLETVSFRRFGSGPGGDAIDVQLFGANSEILKAAAEALKVELAQFGEVSAIEDSLAYDKEELVLELTPQGQALGFTIDGLGSVLRDRLGGIEAATYPDGPRSATIRVELPAGELTADFLDRSQMRASSGAYVALADIVTVTSRNGFSTVTRENGVQLISVTADLAEDDADRATEIQTLIQDDVLPRIQAAYSVSTTLSGLSEQENDFLNDARTGLIFCLTGIFLVLAWIFQSWTRPLVVMAIIPFGLIGTIYGHIIWEVPLSMFTVVGLLGMTGIIINDSIVLVKTIDEYAETRGMKPAIIDGVSDRLRPVLLTTLTTVLGLAPLLYEGSSQAEFLKPTVITLVYGLGFGMVLVLFIVPSLMAMQSDVSVQVRSAKRALTNRAGAAVWPTRIAALGALALFGAIVAPVMLTGTPLLPIFSASIAISIAVFAALTLVFLLIVYLVTALFMMRSSRKADRIATA